MFPVLTFSQIQGEDEIYLKGDAIDAKFNNGGIEKFSEFINKNFNFSIVTKPGLLESTFTIDEMGNVTKIKITKILDIESATEFIRVLKICPKWEPAKRGGKPISIEIKYPLVFNEKAKNKPVVNAIEEKPIAVLGTNNDNKIYEIAGIETMPRFTGGVKKFYEYIGKNFVVPDVDGFNGKILVSFVVEKDGSLTDIKVLKDIGRGTKEETIRVLKNCPKWTPGMQKGMPVRCQYKLPISIASN
jgi:hypothetical protein